jgi:CubicO group peptidase (beta-lactamase class C family)
MAEQEGAQLMRGALGLLPFVILATNATATKAADELIGVWRGTADHGPRLHGTLTIRKSARGFEATIANSRAQFVGRGSELVLTFGRDGSFRGRIDGNSMSGFWIQPPRYLDNGGSPTKSSQLYTSPVRLSRIGAAEWRGNVVPLPDRFTLWLSIFRGQDGALTAAFRDPQMNSTGGASRFGVSRDGDRILFSFKGDTGKITQVGRLLHRPERIRLAWKDIGSSLDLKRVSKSEAEAFYPVPPGSKPYVYARPPELGDGWHTAAASTTGIDEQVLQSIVRSIASADPTQRPPQLMHSILVAHRGKLVLEDYFYGFDRSTPHDIRSAGKTFASIMLGTAPARQAGLSPDSRIYELMQRLGPFSNPDPRKPQITLAHLMTHNSGLACNDNDDNSPGNEGTMQSQKAELNWWRYTLDLPQLFAPGTRYAYCSANINLVGAALTQSTGIWLPELFRRTIADPLQFGEWHWNLMPNGEGYLGGGAYLLPRDLLKVGQTYLDGGVWNGRRIVPSDWVSKSTQAAVEVTPLTTGLTQEQFGNFYVMGRDGLAWHLMSLRSGDRIHPAYSANGNGGQLLIVVPDADLVVVFTGGNFGQGGVWLRWAQQIIGDKIIPAIHQP